MLIYKVKKIPDLTLSKYQVFADSGIDGMLEAQTQFIRQLHKVSLLGNISIHFIYSYNPDRPAGEKIEIFLLFNIKKEDDYCSKLKKIVKASNISSYFSLQETDKLYSDDSITNQTFTSMSVMRKKERFLQTSLNNEERYFYVVPNWEMSEQARLYGMFKMMQSFGERCVYRVDLYTESGLSEKIHHNFDKPLTYLRNLSNQEHGFSELSKMYREKRDPNADETLNQYEDWLKAIDTSPAYICRICSLTNDNHYGQLLLDSVMSESLKSGDGSIITSNGSFGLLEDLNIKPELASDDAPKSMKNWVTTFTVNEIAAFSRLPVLYDGESIELQKETAAKHDADGIVIGDDANGYKVCIPQMLLPKHMFVCGVPGSGKTNTMLHIANSLWNATIQDGMTTRKAHIPFLVLEPAKREYRELALFDIPELIVFSPSACTNFPLKINPFEFPLGLTLSEHITKLCQVFEGAFPIAPPAPFILDRAIQKIYENLGWNCRDINTGDKPYPTLSALYNQFEKELQTTSYDSEIQGNIRSVLEMRIGSLMRREMKDIFDVPNSTLPPEEWLKRPIVIELEALGEGPANFVTLLLCTIIRETLKADPLKDKEKAVRHVIFIEEAHNLIAPQSQAQDPQDSNPKVAATSFIVKMLAEVRALREGIIIADQLPTAMAPEVIKNTNVKLVHRLTSQDDRELIGSTMSASPLQMENMATYTSGQALISFEKLLRPFEMQVCLVPEHGEKTPDDERLLQLMMEKPAYHELRRTTEEEKFDSIKSRIFDTLDAEDIRCQDLINMELLTMTTAKFGKWLETSINTLKTLQMLKYSLCAEIAALSEELIGKERKDALTLSAQKIGNHFESNFNKTTSLIRKG